METIPLKLHPPPHLILPFIGFVWLLPSVAFGRDSGEVSGIQIHTSATNKRTIYGGNNSAPMQGGESGGKN